MNRISVVVVFWMVLTGISYAAQDAIRVDWKGYSIYLKAPSEYCYVSDETDRGERLLEEQQSLLEEESAYSTKLLMLMAKCKQRGDVKSVDFGVATVSKDTYFRMGGDRATALSQKRSELNDVYGRSLTDGTLHKAVMEVLQDLSVELIVDGVVANQTVPLAMIDSSSKTVVTADLTYRAGYRGRAKMIVTVHGYALIKNSIVKFQISETVSHSSSVSIVNVVQYLRDDVMLWIKLSNRKTIDASNVYR